MTSEPLEDQTLPSNPTDSTTPIRIGPYRILQQLGQGGMGMVYLAEQTKPVRRKVALKVIKLGMDTGEVVARFEAERQVLAMMNHPNIATVYDGGTTPEGRAYFVMEYVSGESITKYCDRHKLTTRERLNLFMVVCQAVQHAHQKGIIHRDVKPSNVLVTIQDDKPVPKVIDFGIAKATNQRLTERTIFTAQGRLIGTPEYMSPEQADMSGWDIDTRTDIYSLGVLLYELLVGVLPFDSSTLRRAGYAEIARIIREVEPQKPSTRLSFLGKLTADPSWSEESEGIAKSSRKEREPTTISRDAVSRTTRSVIPNKSFDPLPAPAPELAAWAIKPSLTPEIVADFRQTDARSLVRHLRGDLDWIVMKALDKDRVRRYTSASEFAADIGRYMNNEPVLAGPPTIRYRLGKFVRKNRWPVATSATIFFILICMLIVITSFYRESEKNLILSQQATVKADLAKQDLRRELIKEASQRGDWPIVLSQYDIALAAGEGDPVENHFGRILAMDAIGTPPEKQRALKDLMSLRGTFPLGKYSAEADLLEGNLRMSLGQREEGLKLVRTALKADLPSLSTADQAYARGLLATRLPDSAAHFEESIKLDPYHRNAYGMLGLTYFFMGRITEARVKMGIAVHSHPDDCVLKLSYAMVTAASGDAQATLHCFQLLEACFSKPELDAIRGAFSVFDLLRDIASSGKYPSMTDALALIGKLIPALAALREESSATSEIFKTFLGRLPPAIGLLADRVPEIFEGMYINDREKLAAGFKTLADAGFDPLYRVLYGASIVDNHPGEAYEVLFQTPIEPSLLDLRLLRTRNLFLAKMLCSRDANGRFSPPGDFEDEKKLIEFIDQGASLEYNAYFRSIYGQAASKLKKNDLAQSIFYGSRSRSCG